ncbi:MAG: hypothetical protein KGJ31_01265 [Patescibacteria group bacterium]|nr:hypothetical protein [Patescibacteria group bacterium]
MKKHVVSTAIVALLVGVGVGYAGASALRPATPAQNTSGNFTGIRGGGGARGGAGGFLSGTVAARDSGSITLNTRDGNSHVVLINPATSVLKSVNGSESDILVGSTIIVSGTTNSDGSLSANLIQLRPAALPTGQ